MTKSELKEIIKTSMKEAIKEEMKDILLEALKNNNVVNNTKHVNSELAEIERKDLKQRLNEIMNETQLSFNSSAFNGDMDMNDIQQNGDLPSGEVNLDMIKNMIKQK